MIQVCDPACGIVWAGAGMSSWNPLQPPTKSQRRFCSILKMFGWIGERTAKRQGAEKPEKVHRITLGMDWPYITDTQVEGNKSDCDSKPKSKKGKEASWFAGTSLPT
jgi:hypothetical protein